MSGRGCGCVHQLIVGVHTVAAATKGASYHCTAVGVVLLRPVGRSEVPMGTGIDSAVVSALSFCSAGVSSFSQGFDRCLIRRSTLHLIGMSFATNHEY